MCNRTFWFFVLALTLFFSTEQGRAEVETRPPVDKKFVLMLPGRGLERTTTPLGKLARLVYTTPHPEIQRDLPQKLACRKFVIVFVDDEKTLSGKTVFAEQVTMGGPEECPGWMPALRISVSKLMNPNVSDGFKQVSIWHEYIHLKQAWAYGPPYFKKADTIGEKTTEAMVRNNYERELEAFKGMLALGHKMKIDPPYSPFTYAKAFGDENGARMAVEDQMTGRPEFKSFKDLIRQLAKLEK